MPLKKNKKTSSAHGTVVKNEEKIKKELSRKNRELGELKQLFNVIAEKSFDAIFTLDKNGIITYASSGVERIAGHSPKEMTGRNMVDFLPESEIPKAMHTLNKIFDNEVVEGFLLNANRKDGSIVTLEINASPITKYGKVIGAHGAARDITERKQAEKILKESYERLLTVLESLDSVVYAADMKNYEILYANEYITNLMGDVTGKTCWQVLQKDQSGPCSFCTNDKLLTPDGIPTGVYVWEFRNTVTGRWYLIHDQAIQWIDERMARLEIATDITEQKQIQEDLRNSHEKFRALTAHLQSVREDERTKVAREIHDELSQALTVLKIDLSDLSDDFDELEPEKRSLLLSKTRGILKSVDGIIDNMHMIAMELRPSILDDIGLTAAVEWQAQEFQRRTGIKCEFNLNKDIQLDKERSTALFRILQEALTNVIRHAGATLVKVNLYNADSNITLMIEDNGKGIEQEKIFDIHSFGLLGIRERAVMFGGSININSIPGTGTAVSVSIPISKKS